MPAPTAVSTATLAIPIPPSFRRLRRLGEGGRFRGYSDGGLGEGVWGIEVEGV